MKNASPFDYAELINVFYEGLRLGLFAKNDLTVWADQFILQDNQPDIFFIDLAISHTTADCLTSISQACQHMAAETTPRPLFCALYKQILSGQKTAINALSRLSGLETSPLLTEQEALAFDTLVYGDELAGVFAITEVDVEQDIMSFLSIYQDYTIENYNYWDILDKEIEVKLGQQKFFSLTASRSISFKSWWRFWKS